MIIRKRIAAIAVAGIATAVTLASPAAANASVIVESHGGDRLILIRGFYPDTSRYVTMQDGDKRNAYYDPRKVWVPTGCIVSKDGIYAWADAIGEDGHWKTFPYQATEVDFKIHC